MACSITNYIISNRVNAICSVYVRVGVNSASLRFRGGRSNSTRQETTRKKRASSEKS